MYVSMYAYLHVFCVHVYIYRASHSCSTGDHSRSLFGDQTEIPHLAMEG